MPASNHGVIGLHLASCAERLSFKLSNISESNKETELKEVEQIYNNKVLERKNNDLELAIEVSSILHRVKDSQINHTRQSNIQNSLNLLQKLTRPTIENNIIPVLDRIQKFIGVQALSSQANIKIIDNLAHFLSAKVSNP